MKPEFDENDLANQPNGLPRPVRMRVGLSWSVLMAERVWPALWPASGIVGLFLILALANLFSALPEWLHLTALFGFVAAIVAAVIYSLRDSVFPTRGQAVRHLERSSGLEHRPLTALEDHPAVDNSEDTGRLWRAHRLQIVRRITNLKVAWPNLSLSERDPYALRVLLVLVLLAMLIANWSDVPRRLEAALSPGFAQGRAPATFEAWVTPPAYTGEAPRHLTASTRTNTGEIIDVPAGSELTVRTHGEATAMLRLGTLGHSVPDPQRLDFVAAGGDARDAKVKITKDMSVRLTLSTVLMSQWRFHAVTDKQPTISFKTPPAVTQSQSLRFNYRVSDDYGVTRAVAVIAPEDPAGKAGKLPATIPPIELPLPPAPARQGEATIFTDLTAHVWAGLPVVVTLYAWDEVPRKETAHSVQMRITLPERRFANPLARALIEQRKSLARDPASAPRVTKALDALSLAPQRFMPDARNYLALRTVFHIVGHTWAKLAHLQSQLQAEADPGRRKDLEKTIVQLWGEIGNAQQMLWDLALRLEDGDAPQAQAELRAVQKQLMDALARGASDEEIARLMQQLRAAIDRAVKAMAAQAQQQPSGLRDPNTREIRPQDLQAMMDSIQNLARQGSRAAAQQMLSQLQNMLENMQAAGSAQMSPQQKAQSDALEKLGDLIGQQRGLMDKTFREQTSRDDPEHGPPSPQRNQQLSGEQGKIGQQLSQMMKQLGQGQDVPDALKEAQRSMGQAADELAQGRLGSAGETQQKAIDQLRRGGQAAAQQLMQQLARQGGSMQGEGPGSGEDEDPFGRPQASYGPSYGESVRVPDKMDIQRAREILEELQRRAAERGRPTYELDYLDRLLRRF